ncbi:MAG: hypothetical protein U0L73_11695 [Ruminococcus bromii]|nr:hypothetical protein [Ruminococcus bromii]
MRKSIIYICETCGKQSFDATEIIKCECKHLGITPDILTEWKRLNDKAIKAGQTLYYTKNEQNDAIFDKVTKELVDFMKKYNLTNKKIPNS